MQNAAVSRPHAVFSCCDFLNSCRKLLQVEGFGGSFYLDQRNFGSVPHGCVGVQIGFVVMKTVNPDCRDFFEPFRRFGEHL